MSKMQLDFFSLNNLMNESDTFFATLLRKRNKGNEKVSATKNGEGERKAIATTAVAVAH